MLVAALIAAAVLLALTGWATVYRARRANRVAAVYTRTLTARTNLELARQEWARATAATATVLDAQAAPTPRGFGDGHVVRARLHAALAAVRAQQDGQP